jgi:AraC family transcriptional regulator
MTFTTLHDLAPSNDPREVLARSPRGSVGFPVTVHPIPAFGSIEDDFHSTARIFVAHAGVGRRRYQQGLRTLDLRTAPQMIEIYEAGLHFQRAEWCGEAGRCVEVQFPDADVEALSDGELRALPLRTQHEVFDSRVSSLALSLADEVLGGMPTGALYARGLSMSLLAVLSTHYAGSTPATSSAGKSLTPDQRRRVADLVASGFDSKLTIDRLAGELRLSPFHFARLFKSSFGVTPHEYVQNVRLDAAVRALRRDDGRAISEIALGCGFASQSHLTQLMRRQLGTTPLAIRRGSAGGTAHRSLS